MATAFVLCCLMCFFAGAYAHKRNPESAALNEAAELSAKAARVPLRLGVYAYRRAAKKWAA